MPKERMVKENAEILVSLLDPNNLATVSLNRTIAGCAELNRTGVSCLLRILHFSIPELLSRSLFVVSVFLKGKIIPRDKKRDKRQLFLSNRYQQQLRDNIRRKNMTKLNLIEING